MDSNTFWRFKWMESCGVCFVYVFCFRIHVSNETTTCHRFFRSPATILVCSKETEALLVLGHPNPKTSSAGRWTTSTCCGHHGSFIVRKGEGRPPQKNLKARISEIKNINLETEYTVYYLCTYNYIYIMYAS